MSKKMVTLEHLEESARKSEELSVQVAQAAQTALEGKQDTLTGTLGQVVGFNEQGQAVAQAAPDTGVTSFKGRTGAVTPQTGDYTAAQVGAAPASHTHTASQLGAAPASHTHTPSSLGAAPASHTHTAAQVGARPSTWTPTAADVGAMTQTQGDERYLKLTGGRIVGAFTLQRSSTEVDAIVINGDFSPVGSIYFNNGGSRSLYVCSDENIQGGTYITARPPTNGDSFAELHVATPDSKYSKNSQAATKGYVDARTPSGVIVLWSGTANAIPTGWALCNGQNGTPDLRNRFVVGAGSSYSVGATGGEATHTLTVSEMPRHAHNMYADLYQNGTGSILDGTTSGGSGDIVVTSGYSGSGNAHNNMPPYYALCYIMKL